VRLRLAGIKLFGAISLGNARTSGAEAPNQTGALNAGLEGLLHPLRGSHLSSSAGRFRLGVQLLPMNPHNL
jgi:hypothetical protein